MKEKSNKEGRKLNKNEINDHLLNAIYGHLTLIGDFLKGADKLHAKEQGNPYSPIFTELWTLIKQILVEFNNLDEIMEATCRIVKHSIRILKDHFSEYLIPFL